MHKMQTAIRQRMFSPSIVFWVPATVVLMLDVVSKLWALKVLRPEAFDVGPLKTVVLLPVLRMEYAENRGAAFSLFQNHPEILLCVALGLAIGVLVWALFYLPRHERATRLALALIFGGAVGNLIDRFRFGFVVDFIVAHWNEHQWPTFNIADSAICIGIGIFFVASILAPNPVAADSAGDVADDKAPAQTGE